MRLRLSILLLGGLSSTYAKTATPTPATSSVANPLADTTTSSPISSTSTTTSTSLQPTSHFIPPKPHLPHFTPPKPHLPHFPSLSPILLLPPFNFIPHSILPLSTTILAIPPEITPPLLKPPQITPCQITPRQNNPLNEPHTIDQGDQPWTLLNGIPHAPFVPQRPPRPPILSYARPDEVWDNLPGQNIPGPRKKCHPTPCNWDKECWSPYCSRCHRFMNKCSAWRPVWTPTERPWPGPQMVAGGEQEGGKGEKKVEMVLALDKMGLDALARVLGEERMRNGWDGEWSLEERMAWEEAMDYQEWIEQQANVGMELSEETKRAVEAAGSTLKSVVAATS